MAKEYIDKEAAIEKYQNEVDVFGVVKFGDGKGNFGFVKDLDVIEFLRALPAANVRENVKGEWTSISKDYEFADGSKSAWNKWECSYCGYCRTAGWEYTREGKRPKAKLCEMCGAQMMGGAEDG